MVISSYGSGPRPEVMSGSSSGFATGRGSAGAINYLALMNINFCARCPRSPPDVQARRDDQPDGDFDFQSEHGYPR